MRIKYEIYSATGMEQVGKLLFAAVLLSIFTYLLIYTSFGLARNGGEYWHFDGYTEPHIAAADSVDASDYRFLQIDLTERGLSTHTYVPDFIDCVQKSTGQFIQTHSAEITFESGDLSHQKAIDFAKRYNRRLYGLLHHDNRFDCGGTID